MVTRRRLVAAIGVASAVMLGTATRTDAHPLHTTITEIVVDPARGRVRATVRVFADDLRRAVSRTARGRSLEPGDTGWDDAMVSYAAGNLALQDARENALPFRSCGMRRSGDLVWLCLEADSARDAGTLRIRNSMLCDLFDDQINVVQSVVAGARRTLLFVRGDRFKALR